MITDAEIAKQVAIDLRDDVGDGDITAALIPKERSVHATLITREAGILCGRPWFDAAFSAVDAALSVHLLAKEGDAIVVDQPLCEIQGLARSIMTAERSAMNWLQTLSGVATVVGAFASELSGTGCCLLDTRKTIPGLRAAQKYAVRIGGGTNHRMGLYDAFLIKENHIMSCGSVEAAVCAAKKNHPGKPIEIEVESLEQLTAAIEADVDTVMLDNFDEDMMRAASQMTKGRVKLEVSGNVTFDRLRTIAATGVDYISCGALTKHVRALDLSLRVQT